jgi:hypothetical protein
MLNLPRALILISMVAGALPALGAAASDVHNDPSFFGHWHSNEQTEWLPDGRCMLLTKESVFDQHDGHPMTWTAPAGAHTDGASIPKIFWSAVGGPFEGKYRQAAVNHDYACQVKDHPWKDVHRMFYDGMRASGESAWRAKLMYFAVYFFGPRWGDAVAITRERFVETDIDDVAALLQSDENMPLEDIEKLTPASLRARVRALRSQAMKHPILPGSRLLDAGKAIVPVTGVAPCP